MSQDFHGLMTWVAASHPGQPVILTDDNDNGLDVHLYIDGDELRGVEVVQGTEIVGRFGWLPAGAFDNE